MAEKTWTDEERQRLAEKLDKDLNDFISKAPKRDQSTKLSVDELAKELKDHPAFFTEIPENGKLPPLVEALQSLKYSPDENTAEELAQNYKEDGNYNFKLKQLHFAIRAYTEGIKQKCDNEELNAQLYGNRAAAHFELKNHRQALNDCTEALKLNSNHLKVAIRAIRCCLHLKAFEEGFNLCRDSLLKFPDEKTIPGLQQELETLKKIDDRDRRKNARSAKRNEEQAAALWAAIKIRNVKLEDHRNYDTDRIPDLNQLNCGHPAAVAGTAVRFAPGSTQELLWPVLFLYPEYATMDFVPDFHENTCFQDQLDSMFGPEVPKAPWDKIGKYLSNNLNVYFEDSEGSCLTRVPNQRTLAEVLTFSQYVVKAGTPTFFILASGSSFEQIFLKKYKVCKDFKLQTINPVST